MADNSISLTLEVITSNFKKAMDDAKKSTEGFGENFKKMATGNAAAWSSFTGNLAANLVTKAIGSLESLAGTIVDLGKTAIDNAASLQQMSIELGTLLGSAQAGEAQLKSLQAFAATSPFELPGIVNANKLLLGFGATTEEVSKLLPILGNIAAGSGKPIEDLARIYGQVAAETKLSTERLNQLNDAGINLGPTLAKNLGVPLANVRELASQSKISFQQFATALEEIQASGGTYFKAMESQAGTLNGRLSNLSDTIFNLSGRFGQALLPAVGAVVEYMIQFLESINVEEVIAWSKAIGLVAVGFGLVVLAMNATTIATIAMNAALMVTPYGLIAAGIAGLIYAIKEIIQNWTAFKSMIVGGVESILETLAPLAEAFDKIAGTQIGGSIEEGLQKLRETQLKYAAEMDVQYAEQEATHTAIQADGQAKRLGLLETGAESTKAKQAQLAAERLAALQASNVEIQVAEQEAGIAIQAIRAEAAAMDDSIYAERAESVNERKANELIATQEFEQQKLDMVYAAEQEKAKAIADGAAQEQKLIDLRNKYAVDKAKLQAKAEVDSAKGALDARKATRQQELADQQAFFSAATSLSTSSNKSLAAIGKAAALTQLAIKTPEAVGSSFAFGTSTGGPVLGFVLAAIAGAAMAAQAAQIAGVKLATGGIVPGSSYSGDNVQARLNSGEMVLNRRQQANMFNQINGGGGSMDYSVLGTAIVEALHANPIVMVADDIEIARSTSRGVGLGIQIGVSR